MPQAVIALAEKAAFDVRSCLNTLQFLAKQGRKIRTADITSLNMGQKDLSKGAFGVWTQLLSSKVTLYVVPVRRNMHLVHRHAICLDAALE